MRAIVVEGKGRDAKLVMGDVLEPQPGPEEVRIRVHATAVNHADLLQRRGLYPPPPGASEVLGLECAGVVESCGPGVADLEPGQRVMALLPGGGYAEYACVHHGSVIPVPQAMSDAQAAGLPEVFLTVFLNLFQIASLRPERWALVHGGGSGIGTASIALVKRAGARIAVTCGSEAKLERARALGADLALDYTAGDFAGPLLEATGGVDVVLDSIGASYLEQHLRCLAPDGWLVLIGLRGGARAELNLATLLTRRIRIVGSTLRALAVERKAAIVRGFVEQFGAALASGELVPEIDRVLPLSDAQRAHEVVEASEHFGKVVLRVADA